MWNLADKIWHRLKGMEFIPAGIINDETGTLDFNCTCFMCKVMGRARWKINYQRQ